MLPVDFDGDGGIFYGAATLQAADYNGDGDPEFTLGSWLWSGGNTYNIYSISKTGTLSQLASGIRCDSREPSVLFEQPSASLNQTGVHTFAVPVYNNASGETEQIIYRWNGTAYVEDREGR